MVDDLQHLGPRAVVLGEGQHSARGLAALAEDLDVGVAEAVDRLELVADEEEILGRQQVDQLALEPVRVLELVDEDGAEAPALPLADGRVVAEEVAGVQLQVFEVERRLSRLGRRVGVAEASQQVLEKSPVARGELVERSLLHGDPGGLVAREQLAGAAACGDLGEVEEALGVRRLLEQLQGPRGACPGLVRLVQPGRVLDDAARRLTELLDARLEAESLRDLEHEVASRRAERLVDAREHPPQPTRAVGREQPRPFGVA